jgi:hypothetical protein
MFFLFITIVNLEFGPYDTKHAQSFIGQTDPEQLAALFAHSAGLGLPDHF